MDALAPGFESGGLQMFAALVGVLAVIFALAWGVKRVQTPIGRGKGHLRVVAALPLGAKERVVLIQAGSEQILMGVSAAGIQHLHTLTEPIDALLPDACASPTDGSQQRIDRQSASFADNLKTLMVRARS